MINQLSVDYSGMDEKQMAYIKGKHATELMEFSDSLFEMGNPNFVEIRRLTHLPKLIEQYDKKTVRASLFEIIRNFCSMINVVRNMDAMQMSDCANTLMNKGHDMTLEDFVCMFTMAKNGQLGKILDRIDIQVISQIHEAYLDYRWQQWRMIKSDLDGEAFKQIDAKNREEYEKLKESGFKPESIDLQAELKKVVKAMEATYDENTLDGVKQNEIRKQMIQDRMKEAYGLTDDEMKNLDTIKVQHFPSKINKLTWEEAKDEEAHLKRIKKIINAEKNSDYPES